MLEPAEQKEQPVPRQQARVTRPHADRNNRADRDRGIRRIASLTWRTGAAGVACSALIAVALAHHAQAAAAEPDHARQHQPGQIVIPANPPQPATGSGQVNSGAS